MITRILLVDDHRMFRDALRSMLEKTADAEVVGETGDGADVVRLAQETAPDVVCMDIGMPGIDGIEITRRLLAACPAVRVIALSTYSEQRYVADMMAAGAAAYVTKAEAADELLRAIEAVRQNRVYFCPDVAGAVAASLNGRGGESHAVRLSNRERQVLRLVAGGQTSAQIAETLYIAHGTVEVHRRNIMRKLELHNVADLTRYAISNKLIPE